MLCAELDHFKVIELENPVEEHIWESMTCKNLEARGSSLMNSLLEMMLSNEKGRVKN